MDPYGMYTCDVNGNFMYYGKPRKDKKMPRSINKIEFKDTMEAIWTELDYQNHLPRRTDDEAKDIPAFLTLARRYMRKIEDDWADNPAVDQGDGTVQVE